MGRVYTRDSGSALHGFVGAVLSVAYESRAPWKCGVPPCMSVHRPGWERDYRMQDVLLSECCEAEDGDIIQDSKMGM